MTQDEINQALELARLQKHVRLEDDRRKALAKQMREDLMQPWTPKDMWQFVKQRGTIALRERTGDHTVEFVATKEQIPIFKALCLYFTNNKEFENLNHEDYNTTGLPFSLQKGIWLWGNPGVGKTLIMAMFSRNKKQCYRLLQCPKIVASYNLKDNGGYDAIRQYARIWLEPVGASNFFQDTIGICYNDLGTEPIRAMNYGNEINVMETLFLETYESKVPFHHRHVTTNLTADQVEACYGVRIKDRIRESFNVLELHGKSLRR